MTMLSANGQRLDEVTVEHHFHPRTEKKRNKYGGFEQDAYPLDEVMTARGVVEILEFRHGPFFYVTDDPSLANELSKPNRSE